MPDGATTAGVEPGKSLTERVVGRVVGSVVTPVVDNVDVDDLISRVDVDGVISRVDLDAVLASVDVNALLDRIDVNQLVERVDVDRVLDRIDVNQLMDRVDADRLLERVDVNAVVERTELGAIIARSTTGVFGELLDVARTQIIVVDQAVQGLPARVLRGRTREVPPTPSGPSHLDTLEGMTLTQRAVALQRHAAGSVSRFLAFLLDQFIIGILFAMGLMLTSAAVQVVLRSEINVDDDRLLIAVAYGVWSFVYMAGSLAATGQTIGKALLGLLVVRADGSSLSGRRAALRTIAFPLSFLLFGIGFLLGLVRSDRRELHDLIADTAVIYAWDASTAKLRAEA